jgi:hypothetical protein
LVFTPITDPLAVPQIRMRMNSSNFQVSNYLIVNSIGTGSFAPTDAGVQYNMFFEPPANDTNFGIAFDLLNFDPTDAAQGQIGLAEVFIDRIPLADLGSSTSVMTYDFATGADGWTSSGTSLVFAVPDATWQSGQLVLTTQNNTNTFGFWQNDPADITAASDRLYRASFSITTDVTDQTTVPEIRMRFNTDDLQGSAVLNIISTGDGGNSPTTTPTSYPLYFYPENLPGVGLILALDVLNFDPGDAANASIMLDSVHVDTITGALLP